MPRVPLAIAEDSAKRLLRCNQPAFAMPRRNFLRSTAGTVALGNEFYPARGWGEDNMNGRNRELLDRQMSRIQSQPRRDGALILGMVGVFMAGLTAGSLLFTFGSNPSTPTASDDGRTALAFFLNGTGNTTRQ